MVSSRPERTSSKFPCTAQVFFFEVRCHRPFVTQMLIKAVQFVNDQLVARLFLSPLHPAEADVAKVLDPFEIADAVTPPALAYMSGMMTVPFARKISSAPQSPARWQPR